MPVNHLQPLMRELLSREEVTNCVTHCGKPMHTIVRQIRCIDEPPTIIRKCDVCLYSTKK